MKVVVRFHNFMGPSFRKIINNRFFHLLFVYNDELAGAEGLGSDGWLYRLTPNIVGLGRHLELVQHAGPVHGTRYSMV